MIAEPFDNAPAIEISEDTTNGCGVCRYGLVAFGAIGQPRRTYACLCERGRVKLRTLRIASIESLLSADEIAMHWPAGAPRNNRERVLQLLTEARIPPKFLPWSLASYAERFKGDRDPLRYLKLAQEWIAQPIDQRSDLVLYGTNGTGKTGLTVGIVRALAEQDQRSAFWTMRELGIAWRDTFRKEGRTTDADTESDFLGSLIEPALLVLDEVSRQRMSDFVEDTLTMIVDTRQKQQRPTILTLNIPGEQRLELEESAILTQLLGPTLQDRVRERGQFWPMKGQSRRKTYGRQES